MLMFEGRGAYWAGGQWQVDATHNAIVAVTNGGIRPTDALLTLHFDDGRKNYEIQQTIQPGDQMWLNFADLIHHSVPDRKGNALPAGACLDTDLLNQATAFGSVAFRYTSLHARNLAVAVMVHMHGQPIGYHFDAYPVSRDQSAASMEGIWWQPRPGVKDVLVISNSSDKRIGGVLSLSEASGKRWHNRWTLAPHETQRLNVGDLVRKAGLSGNYGGITFASASFGPALDGVHFLYDETAGFSALMNMFDRDPAAKLEERTWAGNKQWTMWAPMLALQTPDPAAGFPSGTVLEPIIFLRNATDRKQSASITLTWRGDSAKGQAKLQEVSLKPFETRQLEIGPMEKKLGIPDDAHWALVTFTSPASPDDLLAVAASYDSTGRYWSTAGTGGDWGIYLDFVFSAHRSNHTAGKRALKPKGIADHIDWVTNLRLNGRNGRRARGHLRPRLQRDSYAFELRP